MAGSLPLKNDVQPVIQLPQSRRQVYDVLSAAESVRPISDFEVTCGPMTRPATLSSSATSSSNATDLSSSSSVSELCYGRYTHHQRPLEVGLHFAEHDLADDRGNCRQDHGTAEHSRHRDGVGQRRCVGRHTMNHARLCHTTRQ